MKPIVEALMGKWHPLDDWHEDYGPVLWVQFTSGDPWPYEAWFGSLGDSGWDDGEYTHWTPIPDPPTEPTVTREELDAFDDSSFKV